MKMNNRKGFTIVELVIVIAVIGILAGVLIPTFSGITSSARENAAMQEAKASLNALLMVNEGTMADGTIFFVHSVKDDSAVEPTYAFIYSDGKLTRTFSGKNDDLATELGKYKTTESDTTTYNLTAVYVSAEHLNEAADAVEGAGMNMVKEIVGTATGDIVYAQSTRNANKVNVLYAPDIAENVLVVIPYSAS